MLRGVFRTKEGKIITAIFGFAVITISIFIFTNYSQSKAFVEQAVMAENYLKAGNYKQATEAYLRALSMKSGDEQLLTIGLADAYAGTNDYDKALEVLRSCYQKTSGNKLKEKIEEITSERTEYEYLQSVSRAEVYFSNNDYEKAITEFENAKQIQRKEATSYQRIAEAYIEMGKYDLAKEEVLEGQEITQDKSMDQTMALVDSYIKKVQYDALIAQAAEYILQENYEDGITKYEEAISLLPEESAGYSELAKTYLSRKEYEKAVLLLQEAVKFTDSDEIKDLLSQAMEFQAFEEEKNNLLSALYHALEIRNSGLVVTIMDYALFKESIAKETPVFYNNGEGDNSDGLFLIAYNSETVYYGDIRDGVKTGTGIYFVRTNGNPEPGYYYYDGKWDRDIPNGSGTTVEVNTFPDEKGQSYVARIVTEGVYSNALEDGRMKKYFYINGAEAGRLTYLADNGIPLPISEDRGLLSPAPYEGSYIIGMLSLKGKPSGKYYSVESQTVWGVLPFMKSE